MLPRPFSCKEKNQSSSSPSSAGASAWRRNSVSDFDSVERMAVVVMRRPPSAKGRDALPSRVSRPAWSGKLQRKRTEARYCWTKSVYRARTASSRWSSGSIRWMQEMLRLCLSVQMMTR